MSVSRSASIRELWMTHVSANVSLLGAHATGPISSHWVACDAQKTRAGLCHLLNQTVQPLVCPDFHVGCPWPGPGRPVSLLTEVCSCPALFALSFCVFDCP